MSFRRRLGAVRDRLGGFFVALGGVLANLWTLALGLAPFALVAFGAWRLWGIGWAAIGAGVMMWVDWHLPSPSPPPREDEP